MVQIRQGTALSVGALRRMADVSPYKAFVRPSNASNNEASAHAYNPSGREKEVHKNIFGGDRDSICFGKDCGSTPHTSTNLLDTKLY